VRRKILLYRFYQGRGISFFQFLIHRSRDITERNIYSSTKGTKDNLDSGLKDEKGTNHVYNKVYQTIAGFPVRSRFAYFGFISSGGFVAFFRMQLGRSAIR
jgi:hypothetical protein